jgi:class 3 adenylate cyclase/predicted ATPase
MEFEDILAQTITLLQRQGRISYGALKRRFHLDDAYLEDLKIELIEAQQLARDENGRLLVWTGETTPSSDPASVTPPSQIVPPPHTQADQVSWGEAGRIERRPTEAERRQLTVLFCDLADSTRLARQLDPEDLREMLRAYQATCVEIIQRFAGHVAQYLGDGLLVYFGYPQAHEDDAQRAVRTGLGILAAMDTLNTRLVRDKGVRLAVRIGIHTGLVVVGEMGSGGRHEHLALGDTPNLAARLQGLATPDTVVISAATAYLVQGYFTCQDVGTQTLKGIDTPVWVYQVVGESAAQSRLDIAGEAGLTPLVGREAEVTLLRERWAQSTEGLGQVVLLSGEAGIGKSRLVHVLMERVVDTGAPRLTLRCSPYHTNSAFYPVIEHLQRLLHWHREETPEARLATLEQALQTARLPLAEAVPFVAALLSLPLPEHYPPLTLSPQRQRQKTQEALVAWLLAEAAQQPVLAVWEDLHWADPSTLELLGLLLDQVPTARLLLLLTHRPEFRPPWSPRSYVTPLALTRLVRPQVEEMVLRVTGGKPLPAEVVQQIVVKTDGIPLFVEELVKTILESGLVREEAERYMLSGPLPPLAIPATLQDALMARLDRLAPVKDVAQLGAVLGREFSYVLLRTVSPLDEARLQQALAQLVEAELLYQRGHPPQATYTFKHALVQDAAYQSLLRSTRQQYHQRIAQVLEAQFPEAAETQPELLARHYTEGGHGAMAVDYWQRAGERAIARSGYVEAISHLTRGLEVLHAFPAIPERARRELALYMALGVPLQVTRGWAAPEAKHAYARAQELCQQMGDTPQLFPVLRGLWRIYQVSGEARRAYALAERSLRLAQRLQEPSFLLVAHESLGTSFYQLGETVAARTHFEQGLALYTPQQHFALASLYGTDPGVVCLTRAAVAQWELGYSDQAMQRSHEALALARELSHPFSLMYALSWTTVVPQFRGEGHIAREWAEAMIALSIEQGFAQGVVRGRILRGWALAAQGWEEEGIAEMRQGVIDWRALGVRTTVPYFLTLLAEAHGACGQVEEGLRLLAEALATVHETGERIHEAELYRTQGDLLLRQTTPDAHQAETCFQQALDIARRQEAKSWELRAARSLARLWQQQGKRQKAYDLLAEVYDWFTEGFDTADLQDAKALLEELGGS